jgi:hypothetical protein
MWVEKNADELPVKGIYRSPKKVDPLFDPEDLKQEESTKHGTSYMKYAVSSMLYHAVLK